VSGPAVLPEIPGMPGYRYEKVAEEPGRPSAAYNVFGPKKTWILLRNTHNPHMLFPVGDGLSRSSMAIRGVTWFSDRDGTLRVAR